MMFGDRLDQLRRLPLPAVLQETGAQRDRSDKAKWHTPKGDISITGMKFMNWHLGLGGGGAIDLAMHLNDLDFKAAVAWLHRHHFGWRDRRSYEAEATCFVQVWPVFGGKASP